MSLKKQMKGVPSDFLTAEGLFYNDFEALTACQRECSRRLGMTIQIEQEAYLSQHPEVKTMLEVFVKKMVHSNKRKGILKEAAEHFTKSDDLLEEDINQKLQMDKGPYIKTGHKPFKYLDKNLDVDVRDLIMTHYPLPVPRLPTPELPTPNTESSAFLSILTSVTTLPTPEPIPTPEPTLAENMYALVSNTVDKAIFLHVDDAALRYDTAYVELAKAVEEAMEIPVIEIREEIAQLFYDSYKMFEMDIMEKERIAAEIAWEKRMRKKLKRTLRRINNFKGYETPPTPKSELSSHESYKIPPPRPCVCAPKFKYNRYPKDRFGIYLPREEIFNDHNVTATPAISMESVAVGDDEKIDTKSIMSGKSHKSNISKKTTTFEK